MVGYLSKYKGISKMFRVFRNMEYIQDVNNEGYNLIYIEDHKINILLENQGKLVSESEESGDRENKINKPLRNNVIEVTEDEWDRVNELNDFDVVSIYDSGVFCRLYSDVEKDAVIVTTSRCNSNCVMCPASENARKHGNDVKTATILELIHYMPNDLGYLTVTGGEPTLIGTNNFMKILDALHEKYPYSQLLMLSNGRTLGYPAFFDEFKKHILPVMRVAIPLHAANAKLHDEITQAKGSFFQTLQGLRNLLEADIEVELRIVVSKMNALELTKVADFVIQHLRKVKVVNFIALEMRGNCVLNHDRVIIAYDEAFRYAEPAVKKLVAAGFDVGLYNFPCCMVKKEYLPITKQSIATWKAKYYDECNNCHLKTICGGIFEASMNFYKPKVKPILGEE